MGSRSFLSLMDAVDRSPGLLAGVTMTAGLDPEPAAATHETG